MNAAASGKRLNEKDLGELIIYLQDEYVEELMIKNTHILTSKPIREWLNILKEIENSPSFDHCKTEEEHDAQLSMQLGKLPNYELLRDLFR